MLTRDEYRRYYDEFYATSDFRHYPAPADLAFLAALFARGGVRRGARVLDLGCGTGVQLGRMRELGMNAWGLDLSLTAVRRVRAAMSAVPLVQGDALRLPVRTGSHDAVVAIGCSILNAENDELVADMVAESLRIVRDGGCVIATTLSDFSGQERGGWRQRTPGELRALLARLPGRRCAMHVTLPRLARRFRHFSMHPVVSGLLRIPAGIPRTVVYFAWK